MKQKNITKVKYISYLEIFAEKILASTYKSLIKFLKKYFVAKFLTNLTKKIR